MSEARARVVGVIQARVGSSRLPAKVLRPICGRPMVVRIWERLCLARQLDDVLAAIPDTAENDTLAAVLRRERIPFVRGPEEQLATRLWLAADVQERDLLAGPADAIVRITGDCPLIDPAVVDEVVVEWRRLAEPHAALDPVVEQWRPEAPVGYVSNVWPAVARTWPEGLDAEVMTRRLLEELRGRSDDPLAESSPSEWIWRHHDFVKTFAVCQEPVPPPYADLHWSVDTAEDLEGARRIYERLPEGFAWEQIIQEFGPLSLPEIAKA